MKKIGIIILLSAIILNGFSLKAMSETQTANKQPVSDKSNESAGTFNGKDRTGVEEKDSSSKSITGNHRLAVLESLEVPGFYNPGYYGKDYRNEEENDNDHNRWRSRFRGHWTGIELGLNNYVTSDNKLGLPSDIDYMTLRQSKSTNFNINFTQLSLGLSRHIGFVTGLGLNWNNYRFDGNNNIVKGPDGIIEELDPGVNLEKSKLATVFLTVPFMLEFQIPADRNHLTIGAGPIGALKLASHSKMVLEDGHTVKSFRDFNLNMLRYGVTARIGYGNFMIYGTYYKTPLFQAGKGPAGVDLYPFEVGIALTFNN